MFISNNSIHEFSDTCIRALYYILVYFQKPKGTMPHNSRYWFACMGWTKCVAWTSLPTYSSEPSAILEFFWTWLLHESLQKFCTWIIMTRKGFSTFHNVIVSIKQKINSINSYTVTDSERQISGKVYMGIIFIICCKVLVLFCRLF